jgi:lipid-binding SYLF domain-containing protein
MCESNRRRTWVLHIHPDILSPMKRGYVLLSVLLLSLSVAGQAGKARVAAKRSAQAGEVITQFSSLGKNSTPLQLLRRAKAIAVFGDLTMRDALFAKGIKGKGILVHRLESGSWGLPTFLNFHAMKTELGFRFLLTEKLDAVFLFMNDDSFDVISGWKDRFKDTNFPDIRGKKIALGPVIDGSGADVTIREASLIYYTFQDKKLSGEEFPVSLLGSNSLVMDHDDAMNKAVYKNKYKNIPAAASAVTSVPDEMKAFYEALAKISLNVK